jgi:hypothetical protein
MAGQQGDQRKRRAAGSATARKPDTLGTSLRREIYKALPAATWSLVQQVDPLWTNAETIAHFAAHRDAGVDSRGAACAMQRVCAEHGLRAWCYEFGDPDHFTHMVVLVEETPGRVLVHDPYLDLEGDGDLFDMLDRIDRGEAVQLKGGTAIRTYVADAGLEDEVGQEWLGIAPDTERGRRLQVRGGLGLLEATSPGYRTLRAGQGKATLAALLAEPIALLNPPGEDDERDLAEQLGLNVGLAGRKRANIEGAPALVVRRDGGDQSTAVQAQMAGILGQVADDRSRLFGELMELQSRIIELAQEVATAKAAADGAAAVERKAREAFQELSERHRKTVLEAETGGSKIGELKSALALALQARDEATREGAYAKESLAEHRAELDAARAEVQATRSEVSRLTATLLAVAEERRVELSSAHADARRLVETLNAAEAEARQKGLEAEGYRDEAMRAIERYAQTKAEVEESRAEVERLAAALRVAADARRRAEAEGGYREELAGLAAAVLAATEERRSEADEARAETARLADALSAAEARARDDAERYRTEIANLNADLRREETFRAKAQSDSALREPQRPRSLDATDPPQPSPAVEQPPPASSAFGSVLSAMTAGSVGAILSDGGIGMRDNRGGCLCYGPYLNLERGSYRLSAILERPAFARLLPSRIILEIVDGRNSLYRQELSLRPRTELTVDFEVPRVSHVRKIEFRILVGRYAYVKLRKLELGPPP